jgi:hypothetical protein
MKRPLKKQYIKNQINNSVVTGSDVASGAMTIIFIVILVFNFFLKGSIVYWMALVRAL